MKKTTKKLLAGALIVPMAFSACVFGTTGVLADNTTDFNYSSTAQSQTQVVNLTVDAAWTVTVPASSTACTATLSDDKSLKKKIGTISVAAGAIISVGKDLQIKVTSTDDALNSTDTAKNTNTIPFILASTDSATSTDFTDGVALTVASNNESTATTKEVYMIATADNVKKAQADTYTDTLTFEVEEVAESTT